MPNLAAIPCPIKLSALVKHAAVKLPGVYGIALGTLFCLPDECLAGDGAGFSSSEIKVLSFLVFIAASAFIRSCFAGGGKKEDDSTSDLKAEDAAATDTALPKVSDSNNAAAASTEEAPAVGPDDCSSDAVTRCRQAAELRTNWQQSGNLEAAEAIYRETVNEAPDLWMAHFGLGELLLLKAARAQQRSGSTIDEGFRHLKRAAELAPDRREVLLKLAHKLAVFKPPVGDLHVAEQHYHKALTLMSAAQESLNPEGWQSGDHWEFACEAAVGGLMELAVTAFEHAIRMNRNYYSLQIRPGAATAVQCWQKALQRVR